MGWPIRAALVDFDHRIAPIIGQRFRGQRACFFAGHEEINGRPVLFQGERQRFRFGGVAGRYRLGKADVSPQWT